MTKKFEWLLWPHPTSNEYKLPNFLSGVESLSDIRRLVF